MGAESIELPSFAKINWFLSVLGRREDGFHDICTVFQTISLCDRIRIRPAKELTLHCTDPDLPAGEENLMIRAADALRDRYDIDAGARMYLEKNIPFPGGLGGGSSNAGTALLGLSVIWGLEPAAGDLLELASSLGSDVPFFLCGGTAAGRGRGTKLTPLDDVRRKHIAIVVPDLAIPTAEAYSALSFSGLTTPERKSILKICDDELSAFSSSHMSFDNQFEGLLFERFPVLREVRDLLMSKGASAAALSGTGASVFAVFDDEDDLQASLSAFDGQTGVRKFAVSTVSRPEFVNALGPCQRLLPRAFSQE